MAYLCQIPPAALDRAGAEQHFDYLVAANNLENIGDLVETNLVAAGHDRLAGGLDASAATRERLAALHGAIRDALQLALQALDAGDAAMAEAVLEAKPEVQRLAAEVEHHLAARLAAAEPDRLGVYRFESELLEYLKRVYYFAKRIAKAVGQADLGERGGRLTEV